MNEAKIKSIIDSKNFLLLSNKIDQLFLYYDNYRVLIPVQQPNIAREYVTNDINLRSLDFMWGNLQCKAEVIKVNHAKVLFDKLKQIVEVKSWNISSNYWLVDNSNSCIHQHFIIYNGRTSNIEILGSERRAHILRVIYLQGDKIVEGDKINLELLTKFGLFVVEKASDADIQSKEKDNKRNSDAKKENIPLDIQKLLDCDKRRCGLASYEREMLYDIKAGHWDVFENGDSGENQDKRLVARDPRSDVKKNGVIGIDFGTKSTVVVKQEGSNEIRPIRIGSLSLKADVSESDYENPTIISCIDIETFLKKYNEKVGRPETSCDDLFVSYNAYNDYKNCPTENFYAYFSELKQWANLDKKCAVVQDIKEKSKYHLSEECSPEKKTLNPIEIYAYYIGMYINNMRNGIYLKYIMSFPVKYSKNTKELIRKSFEKGLRKSLPATIVEDKELMSKFSVEYQISEPAAYAVTALEQFGFAPKDETEKYLYGIFDFGGGTTDFDFGVWRGASDDEYDKYNCDYVLECFGADSDVRLGGENILEMLAYQVFKNNKNMADEKKIACALPVDQVPFIGGEHLINSSQSANRNLTLLKEALRPLWEQHDNWEEKYCKKKSSELKGKNETNTKEEYIEIQMYDLNGKPVPNCRFNIDTQLLLKLIKQRI
ncbi:MAG: hypothetical protein SOZ77_01815, partial [Candidatus Limousia pullorum]|nr:hypothetical protein [Candidatus Limousia pullorum]